jgi:PPOX class probable F420-dependent enzyme
MSVRLTRSEGLAAFEDCTTVVLTTFRHNGTPVDTAVHIALDGDRAFIRSPASAWKVRRLRRNPVALIKGSALSHMPAVIGLLRPGRAIEGVGPSVEVRARILSGAEYAHAAQVLSRKYPLLHGVLIPLGHRLMRTQTINIELRPVA